MRNIILADNQDISRVGLVYLSVNYFNSYEVYEVFDKKALISLLSDMPDSLVIMDYTLFDFRDVDELLLYTSRFDKSNWIIFSDDLSEEFFRTVLYNSTSVSVLMKDSSKDEIVTAIKESLKGSRYIGNSVSNMLLDMSRNVQKATPKNVLTQTEQEILKDIATGHTTKEIASMRNVSIHTVMTHRKNIFRKIEVNNVHEATKYAIRAGLIDMAEYYI
jgi:DNA-binding NarL/FixJ family response regulator